MDVPRIRDAFGQPRTGIRVETVGPSAVVINKEAEYTLVVHNDSEVAVTEVLLRVGLPATVRATGEVRRQKPSPREKAIDNDSLDHSPHGPRSSERLLMRVTPTENRTIDLMIDWTIRPVSTSSINRSPQPQLNIRIRPARCFVRGVGHLHDSSSPIPAPAMPTTFRSNFGYGDSRLEPKQIGTLAAGQQTEVTVELNSGRAGTIQFKAMATGSVA